MLKYWIGYIKMADVAGRTIFEWTLRKYVSVTNNWVDSAQERDYWKALVNVELSLRDPWS